MPIDLETLRDTIQRNCHIADATQAGDYTLCIYLLKMREFYRWEQGLAFEEPLSNDQVGDWVREREALWDTLEATGFSRVPVNRELFKPFDSEAVNARLLQHKLVYSGGLGRKSTPHFFLGELLEARRHNGYTILISGRELARDLTSPPAMTRDNTIFIRRESLRRLLWERVQEWRWNRYDSAIGRALSAYDLDNHLEQALERLVDHQLDTVLLHEQGEIEAGHDIEVPWQAMLMAISGSRAELMARAVRDNLADTLSTLPALLEEARPETLHFYFATFSALRKQLYPSLMTAYQRWVETGDLESLRETARRGRAHWRQVISEALDLHAQQGDHCKQPLAVLIERRTL